VTHLGLLSNGSDREDEATLVPIVELSPAAAFTDRGGNDRTRDAGASALELAPIHHEIAPRLAPPVPAPAPFGASLSTVSVVVPTLNEAANLPYVLPMIPGWVSEVILVDGGSTDATIEVAEALCPTVRVIRQSGKGKGDALREGFRAATGDIIVMLDADGSTLPTEIPGYVGALLAGADFAKGSRFAQGGGSEDISFWRSLGNTGFVVLGNLLFRGRYTDLCYGYNAFWRHHLQLLALDADGFEIETMMNLRALCRGLRVVEIPSFEARRRYGQSRLRAIPDGFRVLRTILSERFARSAGNGDARFSRRRRFVDRHHAGLLPVLSEPDIGVVAEKRSKAHRFGPGE
jgi:glycosyltransferase involved in cell wall biosynthesis